MDLLLSSKNNEKIETGIYSPTEMSRIGSNNNDIRKIASDLCEHLIVREMENDHQNFLFCTLCTAWFSQSDFLCDKHIPFFRYSYFENLPVF